MSTPDKTIEPRILKCAREEFLEHGFEKASLRTICRKAGVTTGALYKRYENKEALFEAVVAPTLEQVRMFSDSTEQMNYDQLAMNDMKTVWDMTPDTQKKIMNMLYDHKEGFLLLLRCADGTAHVNFLHDFVMDVTKRSMKFIRIAHKKGAAPYVIDEQELHMLLTAYWSTLFEPLLHDLPRKKALKHCEVVARLFDWTRVLGF